MIAFSVYSDSRDITGHCGRCGIVTLAVRDASDNATRPNRLSMVSRYHDRALQAQFLQRPPSTVTDCDELAATFITSKSQVFILLGIKWIIHIMSDFSQSDIIAK
jgi:hypothetical protein